MSTLPKGAEELRIALSTPTPKGYWGVPVLIWGQPGVGKSSFIEKFHKEDFPVLTMIASLHDPTDFNGLPMLSDGRMEFAPPSWVRIFEETKKGILFLDELTTAPPAVQAALLRLVLERKVGQYPLPKEVRIVAAANPPDIAASGWELSAPLANRFVHIDWDLSADTYANALRQGYQFGTDEDYRPYSIDEKHHHKCSQIWRKIVADFLDLQPESAISKPPPGEYSYASPRTWDFAIALMATCDICGLAPEPRNRHTRLSETFVNLLEGAVGKGVATAFLAHLASLRVDVNAVLKKSDPPDDLRGDEALTLLNAIAYRLERCSDDLLPRYTERFCEVCLKFIPRYGADIVLPAFERTIEAGIRHRLPEGSPAYEYYKKVSEKLSLELS